MSPGLRRKLLRRIDELKTVCAESYQVVGSLLSDLGLFETDEAERVLDNLAAAKPVHGNVLPWPSFESRFQWIAVADRKPDDGVEVLTYPGWGTGGKGFSLDQWSAQWDCFLMWIEDSAPGPTHWMLLAPPLLTKDE
jgi:hypothetical protein